MLKDFIFLRKIMIHKQISGLFLGLLFSIQSMAQDKDIARLFAKEGITGTIVISSLQSGQVFIHNDVRANQRFTTASTFKILNTLISLEEKAIS